MSLRTAWVATAVAATLLQSAPAFGQSPFNFSAAAGYSATTGTLGNRTNAGYNLTGGFWLHPDRSWLNYRADITYDEFANTDVKGTTRSVGFSTNVVAPLYRSGNGPYLIGGVGLYSVNEPDPFIGVDNTTALGFNAGGGFRFELSGFSAYVEARWHKVTLSDYTYVPITFGVIF